MKKKIRVAALLLAALMLVSACGGKKYKTDVPVDSVAGAVKSGLANGGVLKPVDASVFKTLGLDLSDCDSFAAYALPMSTTMDEFGVIKAKSEAQSKEIAASLEKYFSSLRKMYEMYQSDETAKLDKASSKTCGLYVMYAILSDSEKTSAFETFEKQIAK